DQGGEGPAAGEEGETPGEGGAGKGGDTFAPGEGAGEGQGSGGAGNRKGTFGNAKEYNPGVAGAMTSEEEEEKPDPIEQKAAEITKEFPQVVETLADQTAVIPAEESVVTAQEDDDSKTGGGGGDAESESSISLKADEIGQPVMLFQSPGTLGVKQDVRRDIIERNLWLKVPDAPPALAFARPTTIGKLNRSKLPKPAAEVYVGDIKKRDVHHLDPNRDRKRHPNFPTGTYASIPYLVQPPSIDGDEAEWSSYPTITHLGKLDNETPRAIYMGWRPEGLYLLAKVRDKIPGWKPNPTKKLFWRFECIEFWFDMKNAKAENTRKEDCQQFFIWPALTGLRGKAELNEIIWSDDNSRELDPDWISEGEVRLQDDGRKGLIASAEHADHKGYTLEMYLPRALLRNLNFFKAGQVLGFHYIINHGFMTREQQYDGNLVEPFIQPYKHMKFHYSSHPNSWGNLQLLGTDAYVNILRPDGKVNEYPVVEVSKALGIQVLDADSDQDGATRDHVTVRVRNRYGFDGRKKDKKDQALGDWEDVLLTETGKSTGVFEGWIPTTVMPSRNNDQKLGVQIGDKIDVYYNDYVKSAGEYDKRINAEVKVIAPVYIVEGGKKKE
ncbi:MAG: hypothetical protein QF473_20385, partial [Planctomycetota bacterium]|nr:hypothetical protein [Planctomycetota bacterium]